MRGLSSHVDLGVFATLASAVAIVVGYAAWPHDQSAFVLAGLTFAAILAAFFETRPPTRSPVPLAFAITF